jgi:hypothetical protein
VAAEVLLVPHHGSRSSSSATLLAAVQPKEAIISCGWQNRYRLPHPDVLRRLEACGARIWRTDWHGAITVTIDADGVAVTPFLTPADSAAQGSVKVKAFAAFFSECHLFPPICSTADASLTFGMTRENVSSRTPRLASRVIPRSGRRGICSQGDRREEGINQKKSLDRTIAKL